MAGSGRSRIGISCCPIYQEVIFFYLKMERASSSETFIHIYRTKLRHIPDNLKINLQAYFAKLFATKNTTTKTNIRTRSNLLLQSSPERTTGVYFLSRICIYEFLRTSTNPFRNKTPSRKTVREPWNNPCAEGCASSTEEPFCFRHTTFQTLECI